MFDRSANEGPTTRLSRRAFLRLTVVGLLSVVAGGVLAACKGRSDAATAEATQAPSAAPSAEATSQASDTPAASATARPSRSGGSGQPDLVVVRRGEPEALVRRAIQELGGMGRFVPKGANVVIKPNICVAYRTYEYAATTNPWVVGALVKMAFEAGAKSVKVLDKPFSGEAQEAYDTSGIAAQVRAAGGQMVVMTSRHYVTTPIPKAVWLKEANVFDEVLKADVLINVPIVKDHSMANMTAGMKNLMGVVDAPAEMHVNLGQAIADLVSRVKPQLNVFDCVRILTRSGPEGGELADVKKLDTIVAGTDIVAGDTYVAGLLGREIDRLEYIAAGVALGLGRSDLSSLDVREIDI